MPGPADLAKYGRCRVESDSGRLAANRPDDDADEIHLPIIFDHLDRIGYRGWVGCEYHPRSTTQDSLQWFRALKARASNAG
jgi:hydroxypyruvate isomerase